MLLTKEKDLLKRIRNKLWLLIEGLWMGALGHMPLIVYDYMFGFPWSNHQPIVRLILEACIVIFLLGIKKPYPALFLSVSLLSPWLVLISAIFLFYFESKGLADNGELS